MQAQKVANVTGFTRQDWEAEVKALQSAQAAPFQCPGCERTGFYGPRQDEARTARYWLCKFCGFGQDAGGEPFDHIPTVHGCPNWLAVAGAPYVWWVRPGVPSYRCPYCSEMVQVPFARVTAPWLDKAHPWWNIPQGLSHRDSFEFWESQGYVVLYL